MLCRKCKKDIPDASAFCNHCGAKQTVERAVRKRSTGEGSVYKDKNGKWIADYTIGWDMVDGKLKRKRRKKRGFATKHEALAYLPQLKQELPQTALDIKFKDLFQKWLKIHEKKVGKSTISGYKSVYKYYEYLYYSEVAKIRTEHLQKCIDECPRGRRTKEMMKALGTCLFRYAMQLDLVDKNYAEFIYIRREETTERIAFSDEQLSLMWDKINEVPDLRYVLVLCYTGMRLGEMLKAKTADYHPEEEYFITGSKTEAGRNRIITISPRILPFFEDFGKGEYLFFSDGKKPTDSKFRELVFYSSLAAIGLDELRPDGTHVFSPHCCRHTFATLMKDVDAPNTDKQKLIGHSSFEMTAHYTHTDIDSLKRITDRL